MTILDHSHPHRHIYTDTAVFHEVDQIAVSVANQDVHSFTEVILLRKINFYFLQFQLIRTLIAGARSDVDKARAIYRWITIKNLNVMTFDPAVDTEYGQVFGTILGDFIDFDTIFGHFWPNFLRLIKYSNLQQLSLQYPDGPVEGHQVRYRVLPCAVQTVVCLCRPALCGHQGVQQGNIVYYTVTVFVPMIYRTLTVTLWGMHFDQIST